MGDVNKLFVFKSLLTMPSNVLHLKQTFPPIIWIFTEGEGDGIESRLPFKIFSTLPTYLSNIKIDSKKSVAMIDVFDSLNIGFGKETCRSRRHCGTCNTQQTGLHGTPWQSGAKNCHLHRRKCWWYQSDCHNPIYLQRM